jgi:hypothetical protein
MSEQSTKWISCRVRDVNGNSVAFVIALTFNKKDQREFKCIILQKNTKHIQLLSAVHSVAQCCTFLYLLHKFLFISQIQGYEAVFELMAQWFFPISVSSVCSF